LATAYGSIANAYFFQEDYKKSLEFNFKKLEIISKSNNLWETNKTLNNIALSYSSLGKHDSALVYMRQALQLAEGLNYPEGLAQSYNKLSSTFLKMGEADSALLYSAKSVGIAKKSKSNVLASYLVDHAAALEQKKQFQEALSIAKEAHSLSKRYQDTHTLSKVDFLLSEIYEHLNRQDLAYPFLTEYLKLNDSINNKAFMRKVTRLDIQHEYDKKQEIAQHKIELLNKDNQIKTERLQRTWILTISLFLLTVALSIIGYLTIRNKNHRIERMHAELRNFLLEVEDLKLAIADKKEWENNKINELLKKYDITDREADVLHMISHGYSNTEIAEKLFISINTVKYHVKNLYLKLDAKNRVEIINRFSTEGLVVNS
jgi:DNA-binding CsgD family transcriptional regulator